MTSDNVGHYIKFAFEHGKYYPFGDKVPADPHEDKAKNKDGMDKVVTVWQVMKCEVEAKAHLVTLQKYATVSQKVYAWIWMMCRTAICDKQRGLREFAVFNGTKSFIRLIRAIKSIILQFEFHKDLVMALIRV